MPLGLLALALCNNYVSGPVHNDHHHTITITILQKRREVALLLRRKYQLVVTGPPVTAGACQ
jgi:hypothetical protein